MKIYILINNIYFSRGDNCFLLTTSPDINLKNNLTNNKLNQDEKDCSLNKSIACYLDANNNQHEFVSFNCLCTFLNLFVNPFMFKYYYETNQ